jgi:hypothetical protein
VFTRLRKTSFASAGAVVLVLMFAGLAMGRVVLNDSGTTVTADAPVAPVAPDTTATFEDINGNGIDDDCEENEVANPDAVTAEMKAVDTNADGVISVTEAAHSDRIGGKNCNHGGYVSWVAQGSPDGTTETDEQATDEAPPAECVEVPPPERDPALDEQKNGHGKWASTVARSDAIGGKNCNHGGAVSEAAKKDHDALKAERDAAKAARDAARAAAKAAKQHGKPH